MRSQLGDYAGAERALEEALRLSPGDYDASLLLARLVRDRPEAALKHAEEASRAPVSPRRRAAAFRLAGEIRLDLGDKTGARADVARALELAGDDIDALRVMVWIARDVPAEASVYALRACRGAGAVALWQRAPAYRLCAQVLSEVEDYSGAMANLGRALDIDPDDVHALRAMVHIRRRRPQEALPSPGAGGEQAPARAADADDLEALRAQFAAARAENRLAEAGAHAERFEATVRRAPAWLQTDAYILGSHMWIELGDAEKALSCLDRATELGYRSVAPRRLYPRVPEVERISEPTLEAAYREIADARVELGDPAGARASLERALERIPGNLETLRSLVELELSQRDFVRALEYARRLVAASEKKTLVDVVKSGPNDNVLFVDDGKDGVDRRTEIIEQGLFDAGAAEHARRELRRGRLMALDTMIRLQLARGRLKEALPYVERLVKASEGASAAERVEVYRRKAALQLELKDEGGAEAVLKRALELEPGHAPSLRMLIELKLARGSPKEALSFVERLAKALEAAPAAEKAWVYHQQALILRELKDLAGAEASLKLAMELEPGHDPAALQELITLARGRPEEALVWVKRLAKASEAAPAAERAGIYHQQALILRELKEEEGVEASLKRALELEPDHVPSTRMMIQLKLDRGRPKEALSYVERLAKALEAAPAAERAGVYHQRALILRELKDEAGAEASLKRALELEPGHVASLEAIIGLKREQGRPAEALGLVERLARVSEASDQAGLNYRKAALRLELKDEAGAEAGLRRALESEPGHAPSLRMFIDLKLAQGRPREALPYVERLAKVLEGAPAAERAEVYRRKAGIFLGLKDEAGAEAGLKRALELEPQDLGTLWRIVEVLRRRPREALSLVDGHRPSEARLRAPWLVLRGWARALLKEESAAREDFRAAVVLDARSACVDGITFKDRERLGLAFFDLCVERLPEEPALYLDRGMARYLAGRQDGALADFHRAVELNPDYIEAYVSLASALSAQNRAAEALAAAERALALAKDRNSPIRDQAAALRDSLLDAARAVKP